MYIEGFTKQMTEPAVGGEVTCLLQQMRAGDPAAADRLVPLVLQELRGLARLYLKGERPAHTLQPTALVNEAYLRLVSDQARDWQNRAHFIGTAASIMRRILIDYGRQRQRLKRDVRSNEAGRRGISEVLSADQADELMAVDQALDRLEKMNPRQRQVVEMRYFGGLSSEETAEALSVSLATVKRDWVAARAWLRTQVRPEALRWS
jgi:RNA polymerase sigma-70 factor, ECF subfamily